MKNDDLLVVTLESMKRDAQRAALEDIAPALGVLVAKCQEAGISLDGGSKPGRKRGSTTKAKDRPPN